MRAYFHPSKDRNRVFLSPFSQDAVLNKLAQDILKRGYMDQVHDSIYNLNSNCHLGVIEEIYRARVNGHCYVTVADVKAAFLNVRRDKAIKMFKRAGIPEFLYRIVGLTDDLTIVNSDKRHTGLPQGFGTSPILFGIFLREILKRMGRYRVLVFVDNIYCITRTKKKAKQFLLYLERNFKAYRLPLHRTGNKAPRIYSPCVEMSVMGFGLRGVKK